MMEQEKAAILMKRASYASVSVAITLVILKLYAWAASNSAAMLGSAADSALDLAASLVTLLAVRAAVMPPDDHHRFGHGKAEALAGLFQASVMSGSAVFLLLHSFERLWQPVHVGASALVIQVSLLAIMLSVILVLFQAYVVRRTGSLAISGDHLHYKGDLLLNMAVVLAAYGTMHGFIYLDGVMGCLISLYILWGAYGVGKPAVDMLMDKEFSDIDRETIFNIVMESQGVRGLHHLKTRQSGRDQFIQMHLEVDGNISVNKAHLISSEVEATLGETFPGADILLHVDPVDRRSTALTLAELSDTRSRGARSRKEE